MEAKAAVQRASEEKEAFYELQMTALNENLSTIRVDMATAQSRMTDAERGISELKGEKLGK